MILNIKQHSVGEFDDEMLNKLFRLTKGKQGYQSLYLDLIHRAVTHNRKNDFRETAFLCYTGDRLGGWALLQDLLYRDADYLEVSLFVDPEYRAQGIGSHILSAVQKTLSVDSKISLWVRRGKPSEKLYRKFNSPPFVLFDMDHYDATGEFKRL